MAKDMHKKTQPETQQDTPQDTPQGISQDTQQDIPQDTPQGTSQDTPQDTQQDTPQDTPQVTPQDIPQDTHQDTLQDAHKDIPQDVKLGESLAVENACTPWHKNMFGKLLAFLDCKPSNRVMILIAVKLTALALLESLAFSTGGVFSYVASWIWLLFIAIFFMISLKNIIIETVDDVRQKNWLPLFVLIGIGVYIFWGIGRTDRVLDYEAAQQLVDGLSALKKPDLGYTSQAAFWGYPMRQYVILALPSFLFGKSMFTAHFAYDFICFIGFATLYVGAKRFLAERLPNFLRFAVLFPLIVMCSPLIVTYSTFHEQTILPPVYAMIAIGWLLILVARFSFESILGVAASGMTLGTMYTPGLAMSALVVFILLWIIIHGFIRYYKRKDAGICVGTSWDVGGERNESKDNNPPFLKAIVLLAMALYIGVTLLMSLSLISQGDTLQTSAVDTDFIARVIRMIVREEPFGLLRFITPFLLIYCVLSFLGVFGKLDIILILWSAGSLIAALLMHGSNASESEYIQRVMVVIPVMLSALLLRTFKVTGRFIKKPGILMVAREALVILLVFTAVLNIANPPTMRDPQIAPHKAVTRNIAAVTTYIAFEVNNDVDRYGFEEGETTFLYFGESGWDNHVRHLLDYLTPDLGVHVYYGDIEYRSSDSLGRNVIVIARDSTKIPPDIIDRFGEPEIVTAQIRGNEVTYWRMIGNGS